MWACVKTQDQQIHVLPDRDNIAHWLDAFCLCLPSQSYEPGNLLSNGGLIVTHNSYDGREAAEGDLQDSYPDNLNLWTRLNL